MNSSWQVLLPIGFLFYSLPLFLRVNGISEYIIDEEFHIPQGLAFCNKDFGVWNAKITTFPGLYFAASALGLVGSCTVTGLRAISFLSASINILLLYKIRRRNLTGIAPSSFAALDAMTLSALPPLYFFTHLYYTDSLALTMVLLCYYMWQLEHHRMASIFGAASVLMRQTNIVWICMFCGTTSLNIIVKHCSNEWKIKAEDVQLLSIKTWMRFLSNGSLCLRCIWRILAVNLYYLTIILPFLGFIVINGSIVVGDKSSHVMTLHLPQILYFSLFAAFFGISNTLRQFKRSYEFIRQKLFYFIVAFVLIAIIVKMNTLVHPYLLADNRHYIFYVWNRFYGRYWWFRYAIIPVYIFALTSFYHGLSHMQSSFKIMFWLSLLLVLCFQRLLELRYFLIPFIIFRLNIRPSRKGIGEWLELGLNLLLNVVTFYIFFTKEFYWKSYKSPQRIIW